MNLNLAWNKTYILGCSFGPDSMALFDMLLKDHIKFVVCNINYNHREESESETADLKAYCELKNVPFYSKSVLFPGKNLNFECWARDIRYDFFFEKAKELGILDILIAHNNDDLLETYLMQKERGGYVSYYGIKEVTEYGNLNVIRPLLNYKKDDLQKYCIDNKVPFSIDKTNFDIELKRNYFRHKVIALMNEDERRNLLNEIKEQNLQKDLKTLRLQKFINGANILKENLRNMSVEDAQIVLISLVKKYGYHEISKDLVNDILFAINKNAKSWSYKFEDGLMLKFNYENLTLIDTNKTYKEVIKKDTFESLNFKINEKSSIYKKLEKSEYFVVKPCRTALFYENSGIKKSVSRWFIDWKMPWEVRYIWPGIFNEKDELLYVPRYQKDVKVTKNSLLLFNLEKIFENK